MTQEFDVGSEILKFKISILNIQRSEIHCTTRKHRACFKMSADQDNYVHHTNAPITKLGRAL